MWLYIDIRRACIVHGKFASLFVSNVWKKKLEHVMFDQSTIIILHCTAQAFIEIVPRERNKFFFIGDEEEV